MSDMKCPMCNTNLEVLVGGANAVLGCLRCRYKASDDVWQELIRTKKQLDRAKWWLKEIVKNHRYTPITTAEMALKELDDGNL